MKKFLAKLITINVLLASSLMALDIPKPIKGSASLISGSNNHNYGAGDLLVNLKTPNGWGVGNLSLSANQPSQISVFPIGGGYGCTINIRRCANATDANNAIEVVKKDFKQRTSLDNGFEAETKHAWYCCKATGDYFMEMWYPVPKMNKDTLKNWNALKNMVTLSSRAAETPKEVDPSIPRPPVEKSGFKWVAHHPENLFDVYFEPAMAMTVTKNENPDQLYLLRFNNYDCSGYFFIKWDQTDLSTETPFSNHLQEMLNDIRKLESSQRLVGSTQVNVKDGYAYSQGTPYNLITLSGDGFLFGFAYKPTFTFRNYDVNELIRKVRWTTK